jgi:hypothetical protein
MKDDLKKMFNDVVSSELNKYPDAKKHAMLEDNNERNKPEDYLIDSDDMKKIYLLAKNKKLSANKIKEKMKDYLKEPDELKDFLRSIVDNRQKKSENKEATGAVSAGAYSAPLFSGEEPKKVETKEATSTASSGAYETNKIWAKSMSGKHWRNAKANYMPGAKRVQVKKKCKKFPYCNQGNTGAIEFYEVEGLKESVQEVSKKYGIPYSEMEKIVINEIKKIFI